MKTKLLPLTLGLLITAGAHAQGVTYSEHIAPIIYNHCTTCHRPGEIAPFSLTNYSEVSNWADMIKYVTDIRFMPPWKAQVGYQTYQKENYLTASQVQLISDWVSQGTPQGNPALEPPLPVFPTGSQVGTPDLTVSFSQKYTHQGNNEDEYRYFVIPTGLTETKDLVAMEIRPGNKAIVHHALIWADTSGEAMSADLATPEYGYGGGENLLDFLGSIDNQLPSYVPGQKPNLYSNGIAQRLYPGTDLKIQIHYAPTATTEDDSTSINLFFAQQPATRFVKSKVMTPFTSTINPLFAMLPNTVTDFHGTWTLPEKASLLGIMPHMHMLGANWRVYAVKPNGDTVNIIRIMDWDFNWQSTYYFKQMLVLPQGSVLHAYAKYDNTSNNVNNPFSPPQFVTWGENTSEEMFYLPIMYVPYETGDEDIVFEEGHMGTEELHFVKDELYPVAPNPSNGMVKVGFTLSQSTKASMRLYDIKGSLVRIILTEQLYLPGMHVQSVDLSDLAVGNYTLELTTKEKKMTQKIVVAR
jgi:hypothetical protein